MTVRVRRECHIVSVKTVLLAGIYIIEVWCVAGLAQQLGAKPGTDEFKIYLRVVQGRESLFY